MATDIKIDPATRCFIEDGHGGWVETDDSSTAVFVQLDSREGRWWGDPRAGSRNKEILESDLPTPLALVDSTRRAMAALVQAKCIENVSVESIDEDSARGFDEIFLAWLDRGTQRPADLAYSPLGGSPRVT